MKLNGNRVSPFSFLFTRAKFTESIACPHVYWIPSPSLTIDIIPVTLTIQVHIIPDLESRILTCGKSPTLPTAHERCVKMGTLGKDGSNPLIFDGKPESSWPLFKKALHQLLDKEGYGWVVEGGDVFCAMLQAASAKAAKSTVTSGKGTLSTNVADYQKKDFQMAFTKVVISRLIQIYRISRLV
jgi:hypothetical protein